MSDRNEILYPVEPKYYVYFCTDGGHWNDEIDEGFSRPQGCNVNPCGGEETFIRIENPNDTVNHPREPVPVNGCVSFNRWELLDDWFTDYEDKFELIRRKNYIARWETHHVPTDWVTTLEETCATDGVQVKTCIHCGIELNRRSIPAYGHTLELVETIANTCTSQGLIVEKCTVCDFIKRTTTRGDHEFGDWYIHEEEGCFTSGSNKRDCKKCPAYEMEVRNAKGSHNFGPITVITAPTCTAAGISQRVCLDCGFIDVLTPAALGHSLGTATTTVQPGCTTSGTSRRNCTRAGCTHFETTSVDALGHSLNAGVTHQAANCIRAGILRRSCTRTGCTHFVDSAINATGVHTFGAWGRTLNPTCLSQGIERRTCTISGCGFSEDRAVAAMGHAWGAWGPRPGQNYVCDRETISRRTCTRAGCGAFEERPEFIWHDFPTSTGTILTASPCNGRFHRTSWPQPCRRCGLVHPNHDRIHADMLANHTFTAWAFHVGWGPTTDCTIRHSQIRFRNCTRCGHMQEEHGARPPCGVHSGWSDWTVVTNATCTAAGTRRRSCNRCGTSYTETNPNAPALGHSWSAWAQSVAPGCVSRGARRRNCTRAGCGAVETSDANLASPAINLDPLGHNMGAWTQITAPTCTTRGMRRRSCTRSGCTHQETSQDNLASPAINLDPLGHSMGPVVTTVQPTCMAGGITEQKCTRTGCSQTVAGTLPSLGGHVMEAKYVTIIEPTCTTVGLERLYCTRRPTCDYSEDRIMTTEHEFGPWEPIAEVMCNVTGIDRRNCLKCDSFEQIREHYPRSHVFGEWYEVRPPAAYTEGIDRQDCIFDNCDEFNIRMWPPLWGIEYIPQLGEFSFERIGGGEFIQDVRHEENSLQPVMEDYSNPDKRRKWKSWDWDGISTDRDRIVYPVHLTNLQKVVYDVQIEHNGEIFTFMPIGGGRLTQLIEYGFDATPPILSEYSTCGRRICTGWAISECNITSDTIVKLILLTDANIVRHEVTYIFSGTLEHNGEVFTFKQLCDTPFIQQVEHTKNTDVPNYVVSECGRRRFPGWDKNGENILYPITIIPNSLNDSHIVRHQVIFDPQGGYRIRGGELEQQVEHTKPPITPIVAKDDYTFTKWEPEFFPSVLGPMTIEAIWAFQAVHIIELDLIAPIGNIYDKFYTTAELNIPLNRWYTFELYYKGYPTGIRARRNPSRDPVTTLEQMKNRYRPEDYNHLYICRTARGGVIVSVLRDDEIHDRWAKLVEYVMTPPQAPRNLEITSVTYDTIIFNWKVPLYDGGTPIIKYQVNNGDGWVDARRENYHKFKNLTPNKEYVVEVKATNEIGDSESIREIVVTDQDPCVLGNHYLSEPVTVYPTCVIDGYVSRTCSRCLEEFIISTSPALGHIEDSGVLIDKPTCLGDGMMVFSCTRCGDELRTETVSATGHDWTEWEVVTPASCIVKGVERRECLNDGCVYETRLIDSIGHDWDDWERDVEPTCTELGEDRRTCWNENCTVQAETRDVPPLGHIEDEGTIILEPTCTHHGETEFRCTRCEEVVRVINEPLPLGHDMGDPVVINPTEEEDGSITTSCNRCDYKEVQILDRLEPEPVEEGDE